MVSHSELVSVECTYGTCERLAGYLHDMPYKSVGQGTYVPTPLELSSECFMFTVYSVYKANTNDINEFDMSLLLRTTK